jgi:hypothetical protein
MMNRKHTSALVLLFGFLGGCSQPQPAKQEAGAQAPPITKADQEDCLQAARQFLGPEAVMLKCGHLSDAGHLEAVAAIRVRGLKDDKAGIPISKLKILRRAKSQWNLELNIDKEITNSAGYIGIDYIDDSTSFVFYRGEISDRRAIWGDREPSQFILALDFMNRAGKVDEGGIGIGIGWNPAVGRFQEIEPNGEEFAPERKNPKHIRTSNCGHSCTD